MSDNLFNTLSFDFWHSQLRQKAVENEEKNEVKRQLERIAVRLDSERDLRLKLAGVNDIDIERLIHYLKFGDIEEIIEGDEEYQIDDEYHGHPIRISLDDIPVDEIIALLNIEHNDKNVKKITKYWRYNRKYNTKKVKKKEYINKGESMKTIFDVDSELKFKYNNKSNSNQSDIKKPDKNTNTTVEIKHGNFKKYYYNRKFDY